MILYTPKLRPARSSAPFVSNFELRRYAEPFGEPEGRHQTAARRRRNTKPWPAGRATLNRGLRETQHQTAARRRTQHHTAARQVISTRPLKAIGSSFDMPNRSRGPQDAQHQTVARRNATPNRGSQEAQHQTVARRRRSTKARPAGYGGQTRWKQRGGRVLRFEGLPSARPEIRGWVLHARGVVDRLTISAASSCNSLKFAVSSCRGALQRVVVKGDAAVEI